MNPFRPEIVLIAIALLTSACDDSPVAISPDAINDLGALPTTVISPTSNPISPEKVQLGKMLFWDPILSGRLDVACGTCHHPSSGYAENLDLSIGSGGQGLGVNRRFTSADHGPFVKRNAPSVLNAAFNGIDVAGYYSPSTAPMFADLRVRSLETQALMPLLAGEEMRGNAYPEAVTLDSLVARLAMIPTYRELFDRAFGEEGINSLKVAQAIAAFERTLITPDAPFDRYMRGETNALSAQQKQGLSEFISSGCNACHRGPMFSDYKTHVIGVEANPKLTVVDSGKDGTFAFRTLSLRNLRYTAPYMHNGTIATLREVLTFYDRRGRGRNGARQTTNGQALDPLMPRDVNSPADLIAFLDALNSDGFDRTIPTSVPSGLSVGGNIR